MTATTTTLDPRPESPERTNGHSSRAGLPGIVLPPTRKNGAKADQSKASKPPKKAAGKNGANGHAELIVYRRLDQLAIHPLAKDMPMLPADAPEMVSLVASIELHGLERQPLVIDGRDRIMDGRHRCAAAKRAGLETVPCIVRAEEEAGSIIIDSLAARRHLTKGALAYVSWPLLDEAAKAGTAARLKRLNSAHKPIESAYGKSREELCAQLGFSTDLADQAAKVHALFDSGKKHTFPAEKTDSGKAEELTYRAYFEPQLLRSDIGLGAIIQAIAGIDSAPKADLKGRADHPRFVAKALKGIGFHLAKIPMDDAASLEAAQQAFAQAVRQWPEYVQDVVFKAIRTARKGEQI